MESELPTATDITVLMTVYHRANPEAFAQALESVFAQQLPAQEIVLVADGLLTQELDDVIARATERCQSPETPKFTVLRRTRNQGAGLAAAAGLAAVRTGWIARLDADDIAEPDRFAKQWQAIVEADQAGQPVDVVGSALAEFTSADEDHITGIRRLPETHEEIARYALINSPVNHPSVMLRTAAIKRVGGYRHFPYLEDYDLWLRLLADGGRFYNAPEALTRFRTDGMLQRRKAPGITKSEWRLQRLMVQLGLVSWPRAVANFLVRSAYRMLPTRVLQNTYRRLFIR